MKNKRKLKKWVKITLAIIIAYAIGLLIVFGWVKRVEFFNNNIEQCGTNYCEEVSK